MTQIEIKDAAVYVGTYAKYNDGNLFGKWLKLAHFDNEEDFLATCKDLHKDEEDPELMYQDFENFPKGWYSESHAPAEYWDAMDALADYDDQPEVMAGILECAADRGCSVEDAKDAFSGQFDSDEDFAQDMAQGTGAITGKETWPLNCIDWEYAARELMYDYSEYNGCYFSS